MSDVNIKGRHSRVPHVQGHHAYARLILLYGPKQNNQTRLNLATLPANQAISFAYPAEDFLFPSPIGYIS